MKYSVGRKSFTLIEMLIVVVIIGILATALISRIQDMGGRARDAKRKADIKTLATALEIYFQDNNTYPYIIDTGHSLMGATFVSNGIYSAEQDSASFEVEDLGDGYFTINSPTQWFPQLTPYLTVIPTDPLNTTMQYGNYYCSYGLFGWGSSCYVYQYSNVLSPHNPSYSDFKGYSYDLMANLENIDDPDTCWKRRYGGIGDNLGRCSDEKPTPSIMGGPRLGLSTIYDYSPNVPNYQTFYLSPPT